MTMKVKAVLSTAALATVFMVLPVPAVFAQRNNGTFVGRQVPQRPLSPTQNIHILPMTNPIAPMGNPIAPMVSPPFVRYSDGPPTVVNPEPPRGGRGGRGGRGRDVVFVPVAVPYYYPPEYYPEPEPPAPTIPGQLPNSPYNTQEQASYNSRRDVSQDEPEPTPSVSTTVAPVSQPGVSPEPVVHKTRPNRVVVPPAIGTRRADVIALFGKPWGTISARGQETLYFDGLTVVLADGLVIQTR